MRLTLGYPTLRRHYVKANMSDPEVYDENLRDIASSIRYGSMHG